MALIRNSAKSFTNIIHRIQHSISTPIAALSSQSTGFDINDILNSSDIEMENQMSSANEYHSRMYDINRGNEKHGVMNTV